jgi:hypothetical protein
VKSNIQNPLRQKSKAVPIDVKAVSRRRLQCIDEIGRMRSLDGSPSSFASRAQRLLLPRYWQDASWRARSEILDTVEWLLRLGWKAAESDGGLGEAASFQ